MLLSDISLIWSLFSVLFFPLAPVWTLTTYEFLPLFHANLYPLALVLSTVNTSGQRLCFTLIFLHAAALTSKEIIINQIILNSYSFSWRVSVQTINSICMTTKNWSSTSLILKFKELFHFWIPAFIDSLNLTLWHLHNLIVLSSKWTLYLTLISLFPSELSSQLMQMELKQAAPS